tara:strand:- start:968 stop:2302 length:1335 start_codon:yes stop_codon:yes gene_type:complete
MLKKIFFVILGLIASGSFASTNPEVRDYLKSKVPRFLHSDSLRNNTFTCNESADRLGGRSSTDNYEDKIQFNNDYERYEEVVWQEALIYLSSLARASTTTDQFCRNSDLAVYQTGSINGKPKTFCFMDRDGMRTMVRQIYSILENQDEARKCFSLRVNAKNLYSIGGALQAQSLPAQFIERPTMKDFFETVENAEIREHGLVFSENFSEIVTGPNIQTPRSFPMDVSANSLPNLWASLGWSAMYANKEGRFQTNHPETRGSFVYAEVLGGNGLLSIKEINGETVVAEIGMTAQKLGSFYTFHNHAATEIYYALKKPACKSEVKTFLMREGDPLIKTVEEKDGIRLIEFDASSPEIKNNYWINVSSDMNDLTYYHENTIHALKVNADCAENPERSGFVAVWARPIGSRANDPNFSITKLCESAVNPNQPAKYDEVVRCKLLNWTF